MRIIGTLHNENDARRFVSYLHRKNIDTTCEGSFDAATGHMSYQIWVHDEDRNAEAIAAFSQFTAAPGSPLFDAPLQEPLPIRSEPEPPPRPTPCIIFLLSLCCLIFLLNQVQQVEMEEAGIPPHPFALTPIQMLLLIDLPAPLASFEKQRLAAPKTPAESEAMLRQLEALPFFRGAYPWVILKATGHDTGVVEGPILTRVRQGQVWRLFTPALLHLNLLHIAFNLIWLWILGRPIEQRIGSFRTLFLALATGVGANVFQYFMSGPLFLGISGVVAGLASFTWMREKVAPWEGYPLNRATLLFLALFIGGMFLLELIAFLLQVFTSIPFEPGIANTAHIAGAAIGILLARCSPFAVRVSS